jgi:hypothetical protein
VYADDGAGRIAFCAVTTPVRIVARLFGAAESQYCTPWKKAELAAKKAAKTPTTQAEQDADKAEQPVLTAAASK